MKRLLIVVVLAAALLCLTAAPAFAGSNVKTVRPPTNVPIVYALGDGFWYQYSGDTGTPADFTEWQAIDPTGSMFDPPDPTTYKVVPMGTPVLTSFGWVGYDYGAVLNAPRQIATTIDLIGPAGSGFSEHFSPQQVQACWTSPYYYDRFWTEWDGTPADNGWAPFNPKIGASIYLNDMYLSLGSLPAPGWYHLYVTIVEVKPINDLTFYGVARPSHFRPVADSPINWTNDFAFYVD